MKIYKGKKKNQGMGGQVIWVVDRSEKCVGNTVLKHIIRHSPDGFNWGYGGSGPADTALSILTDCMGKSVAEAFYQGFKQRFVAGWGESFRVTEQEIRAWVKAWEDQMKSGEKH